MTCLLRDVVVVVSRSCPTLHDPMDCSTLGFLVHHHLLEFSQVHVYWIADTIQSSSSSVALFSFCLQSFPVSVSFPVSKLFTSGGQNIGASASASVLPKSIRGWFPLTPTGLIFLLSKGLSRVFSNTTVQKHQFFDALPSLLSNSHICTWLLKGDLCQQSDVFAF